MIYLVVSIRLEIHQGICYLVGVHILINSITVSNYITMNEFALWALGVFFLVWAIYNIEDTGGAHRFTWWNGFLFSLFCLSGGTRWTGLVTATTTIVVIGVFVMSCKKATLLQEALDDNGPALYFLGTWVSSLKSVA